MRIDVNKLRVLCQKRGQSLRCMLKQAGVSPNAFYTLARKRSILPKSLQAIAACLNSRARAFLRDNPTAEEETRKLESEVTYIVRANKIHDRENVRHALLLAKESPVTRLRRALTRGQAPRERRRSLS